MRQDKKNGEAFFNDFTKQCRLFNSLGLIFSLPRHER
jgi:hypothetical protein